MTISGTVIARRTLACVFAGLTAYLLFDYPVFRPLLGGLLLAYGLILIRQPLVWLAVLPACVALLELAHWSGRLFIEDLDILFLLTLAMLLWRMPAEGSSRARLPVVIHLVVLALAVSYGISLTIGLTPWPDWMAPDFLAGFLSPANALRLSKGFVWAVLLSPFVLRAFQDNPQLARRMVIAGMVAGGLGIGVMALWERGVWQALIQGRNVYQLLGPLLDFSTAYRVTGTFAEMHTGGEAIDGYLGLAWPMMVLALALSRKPWALALSSLALALVVYSLVTTFSRGLYFSLAVAGSVLLFGLMRASHASRPDGAAPRIGPLLLLLGGASVIMGYGYSRGGTLTLASSMLMFCGAAWLAWRHRSRGLGVAALAALFGLAAWIAARGMYTSKWHPVDVSVALPLALSLAAATGLLGHLAGRWLPRDSGIKPYLVLTMTLVIGAGTLAPALLGYRMTERLSGVSTDFSTRTSHWQHAWSLKDGRLKDQLFGMGLGSFPRVYHWDNTHRPEGSGSFTLVREADDTFLRTTGGKDLRLGQRVAVAANVPVQLSLRVRSPSPEALLKIRLCRRFVIHPTEWNGQCVTINHALADTHGQWQDLAFDFDTARIGDGIGIARPPLMLEINNRREYRLMSAPPAVVDMDDIRLTDAHGKTYLANGNFERGMDRWLPYYDFNHLPWHIKNLWLHLYFEQGALGVLAFAASWLAALALAWRAAGRGDVFSVGVAAALTGFVAVGTFGSPIDAPRVAWLYYFLFFVLIAQYRATRPPSVRDRLRRHSRLPRTETA